MPPPSRTRVASPSEVSTFAPPTVVRPPSQHYGVSPRDARSAYRARDFGPGVSHAYSPIGRVAGGVYADEQPQTVIGRPANVMVPTSPPHSSPHMADLSFTAARARMESNYAAAELKLARAFDEAESQINALLLAEARSEFESSFGAARRRLRSPPSA